MSFESNLASLIFFDLVTAQVSILCLKASNIWELQEYRQVLENLDLYIQWLIMFHSLSCFNIFINSDELALADGSKYSTFPLQLNIKIISNFPLCIYYYSVRI